jgi:MFS family permease
MTRTVLSLGNFLLAAQLLLIVYVLGPYLATFLPAAETGLVIAGGAVLSLLLFPFAPSLVNRHGVRRLLIAVAASEALVLLWLSSGPYVTVRLLLVLVACALPPLMSYLLDLLLEATVAEESSTGRVRTAFLTAGNAALIGAPFAAALLLSRGHGYDAVFLASALVIAPLVFLFIARRIPEGEPPEAEQFRAVVRRTLGDRDIRGISGAYLVLQSYFQVSRLYIPLYLHTALGMPWSELGWLIALSLVPVVLIEYPIGAIADHVFHDREFLLAGFLGTGIGYGLIAFVGAGTPFAVILGILVAANSMGAVAEAATESHFFRRVSERNAAAVGAFRMLRPVSALLAPVLGSAFLAGGGYGALFAASGLLIAALGSACALLIRNGP